MVKKILALVLTYIMVLSLATTTVLAATDITVILDGRALEFDVPPQIINGRTMVPLRAVFEAFGATVEWYAGAQTVIATKGNTEVELMIGSTEPTINGQVIVIDQPGIIVEGRTLAPLRFVGEAFGGIVSWNEVTRTVSITSGASQLAPTNTFKEGCEYSNIIETYRDFIHYAGSRSDAVEYFLRDISFFINLDIEKNYYELSNSAYEAGDGRLGYAIHDLNYDGVPELIILSEDYTIHSIYTLNGANPVLVGGFWSRYQCVLRDDDYIYINAYNGAADYYFARYLLPTGTSELQLQTKYGMESYDEQTLKELPEPRYYEIYDGEKHVIDEETAYILSHIFPKVVDYNPTIYSGLLYIPLIS
jgi:Copper amine oxidase N-terminal domain.